MPYVSNKMKYYFLFAVCKGGTSDLLDYKSVNFAYAAGSIHSLKPIISPVVADKNLTAREGGVSASLELNTFPGISVASVHHPCWKLFGKGEIEIREGKSCIIILAGMYRRLYAVFIMWIH